MREKIRLDSNWLFHQGDIPVPDIIAKGPIYMQAKTSIKRIGPAAKEYHDKTEDFSNDGELTCDHWQEVSIPHDYIITQEPKKENNFSLGGFKYENAWYRYHFVIGEEDRNKRICFYFEGVATRAEVYLNGCLLKKNECGYTSFEVDITDFIDFDEDNVLAVYVDATSHYEGWWYSGGGIYRPVWMIKTEKVSVDLYGVYIHPNKVSEKEWDVPIEVTLRNDDVKIHKVNVTTKIVDSERREVASIEQACSIHPKDKNTVSMVTKVTDPLLWDTNSPIQYTAVTTVREVEDIIDEVENLFGFRTLKFDSQSGFYLNGKHVLIRGVNCHQDYGITGKAVPDRVQRYKLKLMKEMGANAFRTSHYPHSETTMDALDEMGFLVIDETRTFSSSDEGIHELDMLVKRDRNRPGVIMWSIGNEEPSVMKEMGLRIANTMIQHVKQLDDTRPVTEAVCHDPENAIGISPLEVLGINYHLESYDIVHEKHKELPLVATECCATGTTRGWYFSENKEKQYLPAYDRDTNAGFLGREKTWKFLMKRPWIMGCFQWDGIEHRGEAVWPRLCSQSGAVDLYLQKKDAFYQNQSHWTNTPMIHLLPHWNFKGHEGEPIKVVAYTNCTQAELFLNGVSLGNQEIEKYGHGEWMVPYTPGCLEVIGKIDGREATRDKVETSDRAAALKLRLEDENVAADGRDVAILTCYAVDSKERVVRDAELDISFQCNEYGQILGTGSDISDSIPPMYSFRHMRAGLCSVAVQTGKIKGTLIVWARAEGLDVGRIKIPLS